jgi:hypothetical protein
MPLERSLSHQARTTLIRSALRFGRMPRIAMRGDSMLPLLGEPMILELKPWNGNAAIGEIAVFNAEDRLVAHRIVGRQGCAIVCSGDATPHRTDLVNPADVVGVVAAVWSDATDRARRVDNAVLKVRGWLYARSRILRMNLRVALPWLRPRTYATLCDAVSAIVCRDRSVQETLQPADAGELAAVAKRHGCEALLHDAIGRTPGASESTLLPMFARSRWSAKMRTAHLCSQISTVVVCLNRCGIEPIVLKGAARLLTDRPQADLHDSVDIDLLVSHAELETARSALLEAGYSDEAYRSLWWYYCHGHHHLAPLRIPSGVPVEIHRALSPPGSIALDTSWDAMRAHSIRVQRVDVRAFVLDRTGTALHLSVHGFVRPKLRDIFLLAQLLTEMTPRERAKLRTVLDAETVEPVRLRAIVFLAARLAKIAWPADRSVRRFAAWMVQREDLPRPLRARPDCVDAWLGAPTRRTEAALRTALRTDFASRSARRYVRQLARLTGGVAVALYRCFMKQTQYDELVEDSVDVAGDDRTIDVVTGSETLRNGGDVVRSVAKP